MASRSGATVDGTDGNDYSNRELKGAEELDLSKIKNKGTLKEF